MAKSLLTISCKNGKQTQYKDYFYNDSSNSHIEVFLLEDILKTLNTAKNKSILDIGCGNGWLTSTLLQKGFNIYGVDASVTGINIAKMKYPDRFFIKDLCNDNFPAELLDIKFDTIISTEVIEHLYDPRRFIALCKSILLNNNGGELILSTPYHGYLKNLALAVSGKLESHFSPLWDGGHIKFWSKQSVFKLLNEYDFKIDNFIGSGRIPYLWKSMIIKSSLLTN